MLSNPPLTNLKNLPQHLGFIVDGNRRWARSKKLPTLEGHRKGLKVVENIITAVAQYHIPYTSFYLFSTENWQRTAEEVDYLMTLLRTRITRLAKKLQQQNLRCLILGRAEPIPNDLLKKLRNAELLTQDCTGGTVCFCFNYGGQQEIADAASRALATDPNLATAKRTFTVDDLAKHLYHPEVPPCDMIVRSSGEQRLSGFMLWRASYAELCFLDKYWPDFNPQDLASVLQDYQNRQRRFGK